MYDGCIHVSVPACSGECGVLVSATPTITTQQKMVLKREMLFGGEFVHMKG